jgi:uncharacterized membrane protein (DUF106 family)
MWTVHHYLNALFDVLMLPFRRTGPWVGFAALSLLTAVVLLLIFKYTSNQEGLKRAKNKVWARVLELWLFRSDLRLIFSAQKDVVVATLKYMRYSLVPLAFMIVPIVFLTLQVDFRFSRTAVPVGGEAMVKVKVPHGEEAALNEATLAAPPGISVKTPALRIPSEREVDWLISPRQAGEYDITLEVRGAKFQKRVVARAGVEPLFPKVGAAGFSAALSNPGERPLPKGAAVESVEIGYPERPLQVFSRSFRFHHLQWILAFFVLSIVFAFLLKGVFRVEV